MIQVSGFRCVAMHSEKLPVAGLVGVPLVFMFLVTIIFVVELFRI